MKSSGSSKTNKRRSQRFRAATGLQGIQSGSGATVRIRDFGSQSLAIESAVLVGVRKPIELEFPVSDQTFQLRGMVVRTDRLPSSEAGANYLMAIELAWHTPSERLHIAGFLNAIRKSVRQG